MDRNFWSAEICYEKLYLELINLLVADAYVVLPLAVDKWACDIMSFEFSKPFEKASYFAIINVLFNHRNASLMVYKLKRMHAPCTYRRMLLINCGSYT